MRQNTAVLIFVLLTILSCSRETESLSNPELSTERLTEMLPLVPGKYIIYRLDSLVFTALGTRSEIRRYTVKYETDSAFLDNLGQKSYRILRFINDSTASGTWQPAGTSYITPYTDRVEMVEDNLRSIALVKPVLDGYKWSGNRYVPADAYGLFFPNMQQWEFTYGPQKTELIGGKAIDSVRMVQQSDKKLNALYDRPVVDTLIGHNITAISGYAKNIGLVYKELTLWENQNMLSVSIDPVTGDTTRTYQPYRLGFGIKMWMIDHN